MANFFWIGIIIMLIALMLTITSAFYPSNSTVDRVASKVIAGIQLFALLGLAINYQNFVNTSKDQELTKQALLTEKNWTDVYKLIQENHTTCPNFVSSLTFDWQKPEGLKYDKSEEKDNYEIVLNLSISIFQAFQNVVIYFLYYDSQDDLNLWLRSFIPWCGSETLYEIWNKNKFVYGPNTQKFTDLLFKEVRVNKPKNQEELIKLGEKICKSEEMRIIFESANKIPPCG
jgi:hypothetical protein